MCRAKDGKGKPMHMVRSLTNVYLDLHALSVIDGTIVSNMRSHGTLDYDDIRCIYLVRKHLGE